MTKKVKKEKHKIHYVNSDDSCFGSRDCNLSEYEDCKVRHSCSTKYNKDKLRRRGKNNETKM